MIEYLTNRGDDMGFIVVAGIVIEVGTFLRAAYIAGSTELDIMNNLFKAGYKLDADKIDTTCFDEVANKWPYIVRRVVPFIPFINIIAEKSLTKQYTNLFLNHEVLKKSLLPINDKEKQIYEGIKNKEDKYNYVRAVSKLKDGMEILDYTNGHAHIWDHYLYSLDYDKLPPLSYTYDEVIELNKIISGNYKLCRIEGIATAVIGIPVTRTEEMKRVHFSDSVHFKDEDKNGSYDVEPLEEPENKCFVIYPFRQCDELEDGIKQIKLERKQKEKRQ